ncbi:protease [Ancylobacter oerskovii]|uniref:Protease n=1 Tax=Ancylobacter oerskovii TaxID=459519 RepID=A0ABW4YX73_9HYPH|nr:protease [Ancylobacter oerskovii]MBS7542269.1 protease [Ancylobacter oerskovii]
MSSPADGGDILFDPAYNPQIGDVDYLTYMQGVGISLGLKYASDLGGVANIAVPADMDSLEYTVMSRRSYEGGPVGAYTVEKYGHPQSYMALDILALQSLYGGADYSYNDRNTSYRWDPAKGDTFVNGWSSGVPGGTKILRTIWDGGGIDIYDLSAYKTSVSIDLTPGGHSMFSQAQLAQLGDGVYAQGNIYNAFLFDNNPASLIENALGGSGNDTLRGNIAANLLNGGVGADIMTGLAGNDSYVVDNVGDVVIEAGGEGTDLVYSRLASYVLPANVENGRTENIAGVFDLHGNALNNVLFGNYTDNALYGNAGNDTLYGAGGNDHLDGGAGADKMIGDYGDDTYIVDSLADIVFEKPSNGVDTLWTSVNRGLDADFENIALFGTATDAGGNGLDNIVSGNALANNLYGGAGSDSLYGHVGSDRLFGEEGNDYMTGGTGRDAYYGGAGYDYAIIQNGGGVDYFVDFKASEDRVVFESAIFSSIGAAMSAAFQNGTDVVIWDGSDGVVLQNTRLADLTTSNFLFV